MNDLIAVDEVVGAAVFDTRGQKLGRVETVMIDKVSGKALYAVMSFGGFLGIGGAYYPVPWAKLKYDEQAGGYSVDIDAKRLAGAPSYDRTGGMNWSLEYGREIDKFYRESSTTFMD